MIYVYTYILYDIIHVYSIWYKIYLYDIRTRVYTHICTYTYRSVYTHTYTLHVLACIFLDIYPGGEDDLSGGGKWVMGGNPAQILVMLYHDVQFSVMITPMRHTGWRRLIGCPKLQVIFRKRATNYCVCHDIPWHTLISYDTLIIHFRCTYDTYRVAKTDRMP